MAKAEDGRFPYYTLVPSATAPDESPDGDVRIWIDSTGDVPLLKVLLEDGTILPFWPIAAIPSGGTPPAEWHGKTIIVEEEP